MRRLDVETTEYADIDQEDQNESLREQASSILEGIIAAAQNVAEETKEITLSRNGKSYFKLVIQPLSDSTSKKIRQKCTKYTKRKSYGVKVPEETDSTKYRSMLIYEATINRDETWDNKELWKALEPRFPIIQGWQTIDQVLLAGEKERIVDEINLLSGYADDDDDGKSDEENLEDIVKN